MIIYKMRSNKYVNWLVQMITKTSLENF